MFTSTHSREETERNSHDKSKETKTAAVLRCSKGNRYGRKGGINGSESLQGRQANSYGNPNKWEENQMTKDRWYSPRLERKTVRCYVAGVAELADALDSKSSDRKIVWVRAPPPALSLFGTGLPSGRNFTNLVSA